MSEQRPSKKPTPPAEAPTGTNRPTRVNRLCIATPLSELPRKEPERTYFAHSWLIDQYQYHVRQWAHFQEHPQADEGWQSAAALNQYELEQLTRALLFWCDKEKPPFDASPLDVVHGAQGAPGAAAGHAIALANRLRLHVADRSGLHVPSLHESQGMLVPDENELRVLRDWRLQVTLLYPHSETAAKPTAHEAPPKARRRGRKKVSEDEEERRRDILKQWEQAREAGVSRKDFCDDSKITTNDLENYQRWAQQRENRGQ